jgi:hypothetical protein
VDQIGLHPAPKYLLIKKLNRIADAVIGHDQKQRINDNFDEEFKKTEEEKNRAGMQRESRLNEINYESKWVEAREIVGGRERL